MTTAHTASEWQKIHKMKYDLKEYNKLHVTTINFNIRMLTFLRHLRDTNHGLSVSDVVRQMVAFAMPFFLTTAHKIDNILENNLTNFEFEDPKITMEKMRIAEKIAKSKKNTLEELKKKYPNMSDFKDMNEE